MRSPRPTNGLAILAIATHSPMPTPMTRPTMPTTTIMMIVEWAFAEAAADTVSPAAILTLFTLVISSLSALEQARRL